MVPCLTNVVAQWWLECLDVGRPPMRGTEVGQCWFYSMLQIPMSDARVVQWWLG